MRQKTVVVTLISCISLFLCFTSCNDKASELKFDKVKWNEKEDPAFPPSARVRMLNDLTTNNKLVGLKYSQLIEFLGRPNYRDSSSLAYTIIEDYGADIDPVYTKTLDFTFSKDSIITAFKLVEWKK